MSTLRPFPRVLAAVAGLTAAVALVVVAQAETNPAHKAAARAGSKSGSLHVMTSNGPGTPETSPPGTNGVTPQTGGGPGGGRGPANRFISVASPTTVAALAHGGVTSGPIPSQCQLQVCVRVDGNQALGSEQHVAQGFIHGVDNSTNPVLVAALSPRSWILADNGGDALQARISGATVTYLLEEAWSNASSNTNGGHPVPPWQDLAGFAAFIKQEVTTVEASGQHVDYWEVLNEPDAYFWGNERADPTQAWAAFQTGVDAVRSSDPSAKIVGPSLSAFNDQPGSTLDMVTFLNDVVAHNVRLDAVAWHEVGSVANAVDAASDPQSVVVHVQRMRSLLASHPSVGHPAIFINEYEAVAEHLIPGWEVGWMGALEQAGVDGANRSCWHQPDVNGKVVAECDEGSLDGLFIPGSGLPEAVYSVHRAYAQMTGNRVSTSSTDPNITAVATRDDSARALRLLVGRHQSCTPLIRADCHQSPSATPPPAAVMLNLSVPWTTGSYQVSVQLIPNVTGAVTGPSPVLSTSVAGTGSVSIPIPSFADGDAYVVTVTAV